MGLKHDLADVKGFFDQAIERIKTEERKHKGRAIATATVVITLDQAQFASDTMRKVGDLLEVLLKTSTVETEPLISFLREKFDADEILLEAIRQFGRPSTP